MITLHCIQVVENPLRKAGQHLATLGATALLSLGSMSGMPALASEFDILGETSPPKEYFVDDAGVLSKSTRGDLNTKLKTLEVGGCRAGGTL